jgi:hypothetical protein
MRGSMAKRINSFGTKQHVINFTNKIKGEGMRAEEYCYEEVIKMHNKAVAPTFNGNTTQLVTEVISWDVKLIKKGTEYIASLEAGVTFILPEKGVVGDRFAIIGNLGTWQVNAHRDQKIRFGSQETSIGGFIKCTNPGDCIFMVCTDDNVEWTIVGCTCYEYGGLNRLNPWSIGNITMV